jgi:hypothetical protein
MKIVLTIVGGIGVVVADQRRAIELFLTAAWLGRHDGSRSDPTAVGLAGGR